MLLPAMLLAGGLVPLANNARAQEVICPDVKPPALNFGETSFIDTARAGGEPVAITAQDGSIIVSAHAGTTHVYKNPNALPGSPDFAVGYTNQTLNWRSTDNGDTWKYVGVAGTEVGPHSPTSTGFSDPDLTMDQAGNIYNVEIDLANVAVFSSPDDGQSWPIATPIAASGDRPWVTGQEPDEVFLYVNLPKQLWRSTTKGLAWELVSASFPVTGKMLVDPLNPDHGLIGPIGTTGIAISDDDGASWTSYPGARLGSSQQFFGTPAVDRAGNIYAVAAGGYSGSNDTTPNAQVTFNYLDRTTGQWGNAVYLPTPAGDALWPWVIAGDDGRVAMVWYQTFAENPDDFFIYAAYTTNGHGTTVTCSDGSEKFIPPQFSVANASGRPIHSGKICLSGTTCNANTNFEGGDRRLGDFFSVNFDANGTIYIVSGDTTLKSATGGPKPVANPIFIRQDEGDKLLVEPDETRPTRCFPEPVC
jgi:hypothetical protein